ncbi:2,3-bisphosphoglycerate-independent phosphoglycerate mutase [Fulvitalea axinellae]|uniref:2,3-bisphosphoglycerate-independent phosphoglycerate mutase n=1 Tax=Fulvitalea axinellae TaxID=1182444 RepID=A0AAU9DA07_9BACT|nr:2,3-bisphosphoglycerate-independent phosphoglycerate mutase [Fulvitalea axinellae]
MDKKVILMILDGWGLATNPEVSAIDKANTPYVDSLFANYKHSKLHASGLHVGLPDGQMGNSEVGHMNLGAGRVVYQDLVKINKAFEENTIGENTALIEAFEYAKSKGKKVHFIGLASDGGVHAHIDHLKGLLTLAQGSGLEDVFVHAFTDGRDTDPKGGYDYLKGLQEHMDKTAGKIASVVGRYYAMDRDNRWERVKLAYDVMVKAEGKKTTDVLQSIKDSYAEDVTDEFIKPIVNTDADGNPLAKIEEHDVVICYNYRTDRGREITQALNQRDFPEQDMKKLDLHYVTMTNYDDTFNEVNVVFDKDNLKNTLGEVLADAMKKQIRIAETEKYPHVTFFFSGGREVEFGGEKRLLCPSPKVATYDLQPEMSAGDIRDKIVPELKEGDVDFVCLNFANTDMVGHTGVFEAAVKAAETVDSCAKEVIETAKENGYTVLVLADHGNSDYMINEDGTPNTAHTTNLVPFIVVDDKFDGDVKDGKLGDVAPTILKLMGVAQPEEMTGDVLI